LFHWTPLASTPARPFVHWPNTAARARAERRSLRPAGCIAG
jgi:hypothetical protein